MGISFQRIRVVCALHILGLLLSHVDLLLGGTFLNAANVQYVRATLSSIIEGTQTRSCHVLSENLFIDAIRWSPNLQPAFVGLGRDYIQRQDYAAGEKMLRRALDLRTNDTLQHRFDV